MNELPARVLARIAGALYLTNILLGVFALGIVPSALTVAGDAAATAHHIQANELLYRSSLAAHVIVTLTNVPHVVEALQPQNALKGQATTFDLGSFTDLTQAVSVGNKMEGGANCAV